MSCVNAFTNVEIELEESERATLVRAYLILKNVVDDMWNEDLEETDECFEIGEAKVYLGRFLKRMNIDPIEYEW